MITPELNLISNRNLFGNVKTNTQAKIKLLLKITQAILLLIVKMKFLKKIKYWNSLKMKNLGESN